MREVDQLSMSGTTEDAAGPPAPARGRAARAAVLGGVLGNYADQFDIFLPVIALAPAATRLYGPGNLTAAAGLVFVATLVGRPVGSAVFGPLADRLGRTRATTVAMTGLTITTALIAAVPGREVLGALTFYAVVALRLLSGVFIGGGYTSAVPLAVEWAPERRRGLVSGLVMWMSPWANATIAALVLVLLRAVGPDSYAAWGWRIPFALGAALAAAMLVFYRRRVVDAPTASRPADRAHPLREVLTGQHGRNLRRLFVLMTGLWLFTDMAVAVLTGQLRSVAHLRDQQVTFTMLCGTAVSAVAMLACGHLSTRTGRRAFFIGFGAVSAVVSPLVYLAALHQRDLAAVVLLVVLLQVTTVPVYGPVAAYLTEHFPPSVRSSGYGLAYSTSIVLPALYPYYLPPLQRVLGVQGAVAALLALAGVLTAAGAARSAPRRTLGDSDGGSDDLR